MFGEPDYPEDLRLQYRFLDLRRDSLHRNIMLRNEIIGSIRRRMRECGFFEFQTPILTASSPEGARDYLVPSRVHPGKFYALPQAPQQFKQLIMIAGFDRYFQIAPCFRDEDARADRSPGEFYQLDLEMSFVEQEDVFAAVEPVMRGLFEEFAGGKPVTPKFPRIAYDEAIAEVRLRQAGPAQPHRHGRRDRALPRLGLQGVRGHDREGPQGARVGDPRAGRRQPRLLRPHERLGAEAKASRASATSSGAAEGAGEAAQDPDRQSNVGTCSRRGPCKNHRPSDEQLGLKVGDAVFFAAGNPDKFYKFAGEARTMVGRELKLIDENRFEFCWIVDFPMYEWNEEEKKIDFSHNPFSMPQGGLAALEAAKSNEDLLKIKAYQYDIVCNGVELSSGAIRNHLPEVMEKAFAIAGYDKAVLEAKFGGMLKALQYGAPPHGGIAPGIDRIVMLLAGATNLRDVIMFPMNQQAQDLLMGAPSEVTQKQLRELHIRLAVPERKS